MPNIFPKGLGGLKDHLNQLNQPNEEPNMADMPMQGDDVEPLKKEFESLMDGAKQKMSSFNSTKIALNNQLKTNKDMVAKDLFDSLTSNLGVDLNDKTQVDGFLKMLKDENPVIYKLFIKDLDSFLERPTDMDSYNEPPANVSSPDEDMTEALSGLADVGNEIKSSEQTIPSLSTPDVPNSPEGVQTEPPPALF